MCDGGGYDDGVKGTGVEGSNARIELFDAAAAGYYMSEDVRR